MIYLIFHLFALRPKSGYFMTENAKKSPKCDAFSNFIRTVDSFALLLR